MLKTLGWLAVGLFAGAVAVFLLRPAAEFPDDSSGAAFSAADPALALEQDALMERVAELEAQVSSLTLALDAVSARLTEAVERANADAASAAAARAFEQRMAATLPGGFAQGVAPGNPAGPAVWRFSGEPVVDQFGNVVVGGLTLDGAGPMTAASIAAAAASGQPVEAPVNISSIEAPPGQVLVFRVTGSTEGPVWGTDTYTDDSSIAAAAVHAGLLRPGESGTVMVTVQTGYASYPASSRFGIESSSYGEWGRSFAIQRLN